jgi:hypothetical protein
MAFDDPRSYEVEMKLRNETKGALRYEELDATDPEKYRIGTLYIRKHDIESPYPKSIKVLIQEV